MLKLASNLLTYVQLCVRLRLNLERGGQNAGILYEVQEKGRDQEPTVYHNEEQEACHSRYMPDLWNQGVPNR
jgi:cation transport regulator ChaC